MNQLISTSQAMKILAGNKGDHIAYTGSGATFAIPAPIADFKVDLLNVGSGNLTLNPAGCKVNNAATLVIPAGAGGPLFSDGANWFFFGNTANPSISAAGALLAANNLSDLAAAATARTNLGLGAIATATAALFSGVMSAPPTQAGAGLTTTIVSGAVAAIADTAAGVKLTPGNGNGAFLYGAVPATPYTIRALVIPVPLTGTVPFFGFTDGTKLQVQYAPKPGESSFGTPFVISYPNIGGAATTQANTAAGVSGNLMWQEIADDGTNVTFRVSNDGINYLQTYTVAKASGSLGASGYTNWLIGSNTAGAVVLASLTKY